MALFNDTFTEASADTDLTSHTPDTGTSWVSVALTTLPVKAFFTPDQAGLASSAANQGQCVKSQPNPSGVEYDVQFTLSAVDTGSATRYLRLHGRLTDSENYYAVRHLPTGHASNDTELIRRVAGTVTSLASIDTGIVANDVIKLEIRTAAKQVYKNAVSILSNSDDALTSAGSAGLSVGFISSGDGNNGGNVWRVDDYTVTEAAAGGQPAMRRLGLSEYMRPDHVGAQGFKVF